MTTIKLLSLLLAISAALNVAFATFVIADRSGFGAAKSLFTAAGAFAGLLALYFTALPNY